MVMSENETDVVQTNLVKCCIVYIYSPEANMGPAATTDHSFGETLAQGSQRQMTVRTIPTKHRNSPRLVSISISNQLILARSVKKRMKIGFLEKLSKWSI